MNEQKGRAYQLLQEWKGESYFFGSGVLDHLGELVGRFGKKALVVASNHHSADMVDKALQAIRNSGVEVVQNRNFPGAKPNAPREDVYRLETYILQHQPDCVVAIGGGSTIDACKAAIVLATYGRDYSGEVESYFGTGLVSDAEKKTGISMIPLIAVETAASSGAHLTKYSNVTEPISGQKHLIVDPAITPKGALFDYRITATMPISTTLDGALDGIAHTFESFCGAKPENYKLLEDLALTCLELTIANTHRILKDPSDMEAREALGLATDLGGYAIMVGGTSGAHLTSFSLVDLVAHGTACGIMNPYFAVFYSPAIQPQLEAVGKVLKKYGFMDQDPSVLKGRERAEAVAKGLIAFGRSIGAPVCLADLPGFSKKHVDRILTAAKDPSLSMKLKNMPVSMTSDDVDLYMEPVVRAAVNEDLSCIVNK